MLHYKIMNVLVFGTVGGLLDQTTPMICGGQTPKTNQCYKYQAGAWLQTFPMVKPRVHFMGFSTSSDLDWPYRFLVVGKNIVKNLRPLFPNLNSVRNTVQRVKIVLSNQSFRVILFD